MPGLAMSGVPTMRPVPPVWKWILGVFTLGSFTPIIMPFLAYFLASTLGCRLNEAGSHPCLLAGRDIGETLYTMAMMMWLAFLTFPLMALALVGWIIVWVRRAR
ncbi:hypothetical protein [Roseococcus pinisoli]|uniref:Uncharacterized protein n=1 Tax=Roseococcus pinisoli TaxID=2835040 RepID=A0ABS5QIL7_9PROT|nr:hypothetical protein [Roseococcus pinisoli]MBS7813422.1 hypothetical protein [Roseococcus pinisoli]